MPKNILAEMGSQVGLTPGRQNKKSQLMKLKTEDGRIVSSKPELLDEIEKFYGELVIHDYPRSS